MKPRHIVSQSTLITKSFAVAAAMLLAHAAQAAPDENGTWNTTTSGELWNTPTSWVDDIIADGASFTAFFNALDPAAATTVNLDSARTIGTLIFGDTTPSASTSWILANNSTPANILTLGGAATVTVDAMSSVNNTGTNVTISAVIDGANGLTKNGTGTNSTGTNNTSGTGTLTLSAANTYTGATNIQTGTIRATNASAFGGVAGGKLATNVVNVSNGARLLLGGVTIANTVNLNGTNAIAVSGGNSGLSGLVNLESNSSAYINNGGNYTLNFSSTSTLALDVNVLTINTSGANNGALISGTLTGSGTSGISKNGNGPLTMSADGSGYSGTTTHSSGEILVGSDTALGTGTYAIRPPNDGSLTIRSNSATDRTSAAAITLPQSVNNGNTSGKFVFGSASTGNLTFTDTTGINLGSATRRFDVDNRTQFDSGFSGGSGVGLTLETGSVGTLVLNGANTYSGATTINAGTLKLGAAGSLEPDTIVNIKAGGTLDLTDLTLDSAIYYWIQSLSASGAATPATITGTTGGIIDMEATTITLTHDGTNPPLTVSGAALLLGGNAFKVVVPGAALEPGVYTLITAGSLSGSVDPTPDYTGGNGVGEGATGEVSISGNTVILTVTGGGAPTNFADWADDNGVTGGVNGDSDNDGIPNGVEYGLNLDFTGSDGSPGSFTGTVVTFDKRAETSGNSDLDYRIEVSTDLGVSDPWAEVGAYLQDDASVISATISSGPVKNFARLRVVVTP